MTTATKIDLNHYLQHKPLWNVASISYALAGYLGGISLIILDSLWLNALGLILLAHSLVISAYLAHEFMHGSMFASKQSNAIAGNIMLWITGGCYAKFSDLMRLHIAHHVNRVDFYRFDLEEFLASLPTPMRSLLLGLEWCYFPSLAFLTRIRSMFAPFYLSDRQDERLRVSLIFLIRATLFGVLGWISVKSLVLYFVSFIAMIHILRFVDAFQHTYEVFAVGSDLPKRDRAHEQANTFSNVISLRYRWLNLLLLNFGYHNAHHELMKCPWYSLPELDKELYTGDEIQYITLPELIGNYHRFRLSRIYSGQGSAVDEQGNRQLETFYGGTEVSFLVLP
jgi:fatty acid desaturase